VKSHTLLKTRKNTRSWPAENNRGEHGSDWGGYHGYPKPDPQCSGLLKGTRNPHFFSLIRWVAGLRGGARGGAGIYPI
jgi:hypothetical protein